MGVLHGRDLFSSKYVTAIVVTPQNTCYFVPIKRTLGQYWVCEIEHRTYVFRIEGSHIITRAASAVRPVRLLIYHTSHIMPLGDTSALDRFLGDNNLGRFDRLTHVLLRLMGKQQRYDKNGKPRASSIPELADWVGGQLKDDAPDSPLLDPSMREITMELKEFLDNLAVEHVVGDTRAISEYLDSDLLVTNPGFFGDIIDHLKHVDFEGRIICNTPLTAARDWTKLLAILFGVVGVAVAAFLAYQSGMFDGLLGGSLSLPGFTAGPQDDSAAEWMVAWPDAGELRDAVDNGTVSRNSLPDSVKDLIDGLPSVDAILP